ncbi:VOC family protein [Sulfobacillus thermosulfidooxidans]|uniref:VOC family protein n=1 Tax=Sulfobacillus thermosulfidooxidans TaxID=28034 RepID=UPI0006B481DD|nr:VOC family protein [Sulfobacillus thermosulfidooxidans]
MSFSFVGIDHIQLAIPEHGEAEARQFFGQILGWQEIPKPDILRKRGGMWFQCGSQQVHIGIQKDFVAATKAHPAFYVKNLDQFRQYLEASGIHPIEGETVAGTKRFYLFDPFGNRLEFLESL